MEERHPWNDAHGPNPDPNRESWSFAERHATKFHRCGRNYLPLSNNSGVACGLDILFLRRDQPGNLIRSGGDIDNRIKVFFDALRMPQSADEAGRQTDEGGQPVLCAAGASKLDAESARCDSEPMTQAAKKLLDAFDALPDQERAAVLAELLRRAALAPHDLPTDEDLIATADHLFRELDQRESE